MQNSKASNQTTPSLEEMVEEIMTQPQPEKKLADIWNRRSGVRTHD